MLRHFVLIRYDDAVTETHIAEFCQRMYALKSLIPDVAELEIARDILRDKRSWDLMLMMGFDSVESLRRYQKHEAHQAVMQFNDPLVKDIASFDYEHLVVNTR
jgi:hypothetical protein